MLKDKKSEQGARMKYILSFAAAAAAIIMLLEPSIIAAAVKNSVNICLEVMIPSLFAFTVLAVYLQESGLYRTMLKPLTYPLSRLMRLDEELCAVFILSNIGGYPVGAKLLSNLVDNGRLSRSNAGRMLCFCYGSGPSFIISIVGQRVFGSTTAGLLIFVACFLSSFILGILLCRCGRRIRIMSHGEKLDLSSGCFVSSVMSAAKVMLTVCTMIVCFSAVSAMIESTGAMDAAEKLFSLTGAGVNSSAILPTILEISHIQHLTPSDSSVAALCGSLLSFGGICVILQISAISHAYIPLKNFLIMRLPAMFISSAFSIVVSHWCIISEQGTYIPTSAKLQADAFSVNAGMSLCVLAMCVILLISAPAEK